MLGSLNTLILNVWKLGGNISVKGSFYAFFSRLYHAPVKVYVQEKYLLSRNSLCKEVAVLSIVTSVLKKYLLQNRSSFNAEADQEMQMLQRNLFHLSICSNQ